MMLGTYASIPLGILIDPSYFGIAGCYLVYIIYSCCTSATKYIKNLVTNDELKRNIALAIKSRPDIHMSIQNYHYETRIVHDRDSEGNTRTRTETHTVYTHYARENFNFTQW